MSRGALVFVVPQLAPVYGLERATLALVRHLGRSRRVVVLALSGGLPPVRDDDDWGFVSLRLGRGSARIVRAVRPLRAALTDLGPGTVVASGLWAAIPTLLAARRCHDVVVWEHSLMAARLRSEPRLRLLARAARHVYPRARAVVAVSGAVAQALAGLCGDRVPVRVLPNVVEVGGEGGRPRAVPGPGLRLLSVGSLSVGKNHRLAIQALAHLPADATLTVCGEGPEQGRLAELATELGVEDRVTLAGYCSDIARRIADHDVVVHPSWAETFGLAALEASALGRPVVVLDRASLNEVVPRLCPGAVSADDTPRAFARAVTEAASVAGDVAVFDTARRAREAELGAVAVVAGWQDLLVSVGSGS